jgi:hypothetical protein
MANIQQAAKWMQEGRTVRRISNSYEFFTMTSGLIMHERLGAHPLDTAVFSVDDLLADDWEIAD